DRPDAYGHRKLHHGCVADHAAPRQRVGQQHHGQSGQHSKNQLAFPVHVVESPVPGGFGGESRASFVARKYTPENWRLQEIYGFWTKASGEATSSENLLRSMLPPLTMQTIFVPPVCPLSPAATAQAAAPSQTM